MQLNSLVVLSAALLFGARHPTPTVVLVPQTDAIRTALPGAKQFFVRNVTIGQDDLARIRKDIDYSPQDPDFKFYLGKREDGSPAGVVLFPQVNTLHGPLEVALSLNPDGSVASAVVTKATVETKPWVLDAVRSGLMKRFQGAKYGDELGSRVQDVSGGSMAKWQAQVIATAVYDGLVLHHVLFKG